MHFELELTQPLQTVAIWQRLVVAGGNFFLVDLGLGAAVGGMQLEIDTGYSCYLICNNSRHKMALKSITDINSCSSFLSLSVFVFVFSIFAMTSRTFFQSFLLHPRILPRSTASRVKMLRGGYMGEDHLPEVIVTRPYCSSIKTMFFSQNSATVLERKYKDWTIKQYDQI